MWNIISDYLVGWSCVDKRQPVTLYKYVFTCRLYSQQPLFSHCSTYQLMLEETHIQHVPLPWRVSGLSRFSSCQCVFPPADGTLGRTGRQWCVVCSATLRGLPADFALLDLLSDPCLHIPTSAVHSPLCKSVHGSGYNNLENCGNGLGMPALN